MDFRLDREHAVSAVRVLDTEVTQAAEHDFILPDYCPDIFRVLRCSVTPGITSTGINGSRLSFDLSVVIRVLYRTADGCGIHCVEHTQEFTRTLDLPPDTVSPAVNVIPTVQHVNCRVVDKRRLDVRGSVSCRVTVDGEQCAEVLKAAYGCGIQLKKVQTVYPSKRLVSAKRITVIEELELAQGKPEFGSVLRSGVSIIKGEQKLIPGKLITKGEAQVAMLYLPKGLDEPAPETMRFAIPFSQIIDMEGIEEDLDTDINITAAKCVITPKSDDSGLLECELVLLVNVTAVKYDSAELVTDAYSTRYECVCERMPGMRMSPPKRTSMPCTVQCSITCPEGEPAQVYDLWCEGVTGFIKRDEESGGGLIYGKLSFCMLGRLADGSAVYSEKEAAFEQAFNIEGDCADGLWIENTEVSARVCGCSYSLSEDGSVSAKAELELAAAVYSGGSNGIIAGVMLDTERPKQCDKRCAVKICYTDSGESLWDIAKKYSTEAQALADENPPCEDGGRRVLIIPMKN